MDLLVSDIIDQLPPCNGEKPSFRFFWYAVKRPRFERRAQRIAESIFRRLARVHRLSFTTLEDRPHFDYAACGCRTPCSPLECCIEIGHIDQTEPAKLLLGVSIRSVLNLTSPSIHAHSRSSMSRLQRCAAAHDPRIGQR